MKGQELQDLRKHIKKHRDQLTRQEVTTLIGQGKAGQTEAALKGLKKILQRKKK